MPRFTNEDQPLKWVTEGSLSLQERKKTEGANIQEEYI